MLISDTMNTGGDGMNNMNNETKIIKLYRRLRIRMLAKECRERYEKRMKEEVESK